MTREASAATSRGAVGSPHKKKRTPKKATFNFNIKSMLHLFRPDCVKFLPHDASPIRTQKRTRRSVSEPMTRINRVSAFDGEDKEKDSASDNEQPQHNGVLTQEQESSTHESMIHMNLISSFDDEDEEKDSASDLEQPDQSGESTREQNSPAQEGITPQLTLDSSAREQDDGAVLMTDELRQEFLCALQPADAEKPRRSDDGTQLARYERDHDQDDGTVSLAEERAQQLLCEPQLGDAEQSPSRPVDLEDPLSESHEEQVHDATICSEHADGFDDQDEERRGTRQCEAHNEKIVTDKEHSAFPADMASLPFDPLECAGGKKTNAIDPASHFTQDLLHKFGIDDDEQLPGWADVFGDASFTVDEDGAGLCLASPTDSVSNGSGESEACRILKHLDSGRKSTERHTERSKFVLPLSRIDEEEGSDDDDNQLGGDLSVGASIQLIASSGHLRDVIPATTTHRLRVGVLPGSPIHTSARLMSIFEDEEEKNDEDNHVESFSDHETSLSGEPQFSSGTDSMTSTSDECRTQRREDEFMVVHPADASDVPGGRRFDSSYTPDFTPTSPVEVVGTPDVVVWLASRGEDLLDIQEGLLDDGSSTWTNCSSYDGDSGIGPSFGADDVELYIEAAGYTDSVLSGEELVAELDRAEERLESTIVVVREAIELASEVLRMTGDHSEEMNVHARTPHNGARHSAIASDDAAIDHSDSDVSGHEMLLSNDEFLIDPTTAHPEDPHDLGTIDTDTTTFAAVTRSDFFHFQADLHNGEDASSSPIGPLNDEFKVRDILSEAVRSATTQRSPFAEIYGSEDFGGHSEASADVLGALLGAELAPGYEQKAVDGSAAPSSSCDVTSTEPSCSTADSPPSADQDLEEVDRGRRPLVFALWMLAIVGGVLFGVILFDLQSPEQPRCDQQNLSTRCHEVWDAIAIAEQHKSALPAALTPAAKLDQALPGLLESVVIAACELVVDMHTNDELAAVECGLLAAVEDEGSQVDTDHTSPAIGNRAGHYILGLAITLLGVAFLQYDSRQ